VFNGNEALPALLEAISNAQHHVHIETMFFLDDEAGQAVAASLTDAAERGVEVRLLFDWELSSMADPWGIVSDRGTAQGEANLQSLIESMQVTGVQVLNSYPVARGPLPGIEESYAIEQENIYDEVCLCFNHRDHRKVIVIDGVITLVGGMNIASHYLYDTPFDPAITDAEHGSVQWHDFQLHLRGPVVAELQRAFVARWRNSGGDSIPLSDPTYFPTSASEENVVIQVLRQAPGQHEVSTAYYELIAQAEQEIWIESPYVLHEPLLHALREAAQRGVRVILIVPGPYHDSPMVRLQMLPRYETWQAGGIELYEYDNRMLHDKTMIVDGRWVIFGSFNLDARSFFHDLEMNILIDEPGFAELIRERLFEEDLQFSTSVHEVPSVPWYWWLLIPARPFS